jgi:hypothetical protein
MDTTSNRSNNDANSIESIIDKYDNSNSNNNSIKSILNNSSNNNDDDNNDDNNKDDDDDDDDVVVQISHQNKPTYHNDNSNDNIHMCV